MNIRTLRPFSVFALASHLPVSSKALLIAVTAVFTIAAAGCTGGSSTRTLPPPPPTPTPTPAPPTPTPTPTPVAGSLSGTVIQGPMRSSAITVNAVDPATGANGAALGTATTGSVDGTFSVNVTPQTGPVRITTTGGNYVSEMNGATIGSPSSVTILLASANAPKSGISINPLTTFIDARAVNLIAARTPFATALADATSQIEAIYGLNADPGTLIPSYTTTTNPQANLGLILGAIINEDQSLCPATPGALVTALAQDISDGVFDGMASGVAVKYCGGDLPAIAGTIDFQDALSGLAQLQNVTQAFAFGGTNNILQTNGLVNLMANPPVAYPLTPLETINISVPHAAPSPVNKFAAQSATPDMVSATYDAASVVLPNGKVFVAGGSDGTSPFLNTTQIWNPTTTNFVAGPTMNSPRANETATLLPNGKVLIAGGAVSDTAWTATTDIFDPTNLTATTLGPNMNSQREGASAILLPNGQVLIAGGRDSAGTLNTADLYNPASGPNGSIIATGTLNTSRYDAAAVLLPDGTVLIAGGFNSVIQSGPLNTAEIYNPATGKFTLVTNAMTDNRGAERATLLPNGKVLIAGGTNNTGVLNTAELYDPAAKTFTAITSTMSSARKFQSQILLPNGKVLIAGGFADNTGANVVTSTDLYDPVANSFTAGPAMNFPHGLASTSLLQDGRVLIAGGLGLDGAVINFSDIYTP